MVALGVEDATAIGVAVGVVWIDFNGLAVVRNSAVFVALGLISETPANVSVSEPRVNFYCFCAISDRRSRSSPSSATIARL